MTSLLGSGFGSRKKAGLVKPTNLNALRFWDLPACRQTGVELIKPNNFPDGQLLGFLLFLLLIQQIT